MVLLICNRCGAKYAVGSPYCPQCTSTDYRPEGEEDVPKITQHGGPSDASVVPPEETAVAVNETDEPPVRDTGEGGDGPSPVSPTGPGEQPAEPQTHMAPESTVPQGSVDEVLSWVGDDQDRARNALAVENSKSSPRTTLVRELERRLV